MKKAQDFLIDSKLSEKPFELNTAGKDSEEKIVLAIEEGAVPSNVLEKQESDKRNGKKTFFQSLNNALRSIGKPKSKDKATFFRLMSVMINAGIPLIKSLDTIGDQTGNFKLRNAINYMARSVERGQKLSESMGRFPGIFSESHIGMIKSGEASGQMNQILKQLALEVEKSAAITRKVKGAMMYPVFVILVMIGVISAMMVAVVPKISEVFLQSGKELPTLTKVVISASDFIRFKWPILVGAIIAAAVFFILFHRTKKGKYFIDWLLIHLPLFGGLLRKSILARFSRSLSNLLSSGIPIIQGLLINARGLGNEIYRNRVELSSEDLSRGIPLGESLRDTPEFPSMMVQMISVGEQTAQLDSIAGKIAEYYEDEVDTAVAGISKVIEPAILVVVGVVVGGLIAAIMLPIIQLTENTGGL